MIRKYQIDNKVMKYGAAFGTAPYFTLHIKTQIPVGIILYEMKKGLNKRFFQKKHEKRLIFLSEYGIIRLYFIR